MTGIVEIIGRGDELSHLVGDALMLLIRRGAELGELDDAGEADCPLCDRGQPQDGGRRRKLVPPLWLRRLERAAQSGAFGRKSITEIVDTILIAPPPADLVETAGEETP